MTESVTAFKKSSKLLRGTAAFAEHVSQMIARVEHMYEQVQSVKSANKNVVEQKLEGLYADLNEIQETAEMAKSKKQLSEENVTVQLTGLPDEIDLEQIGVDLIAGDEEVEEMPGDELAVDGMGDEGEDLDLDLGGDVDGDEGMDLDLGSDEEEEPVAEEGFETMSEDTVVEIDESMLRKEIAKFKKIKEHSAVDASVLDDFGGGKSEGDPWLDGDVDDEDGEGTVTVAEALDFGDDDFAGADHGHGHEPLDPNSFEGDDVDLSGLDHKHESLDRALALETRLLARSKARILSIRSAMTEAKTAKDGKKLNQLTAAHKTAMTQLKENAAKVEKIKGDIAKSKKPVNEGRDNRASKAAAGDKASETLRTQLAETNLQNTKLRLANKLLQNESLSTEKRAHVIERLDEAKTEREAKLIYESVTKALQSKSNGGRQVLGSASRPTRSGSSSTSTQISESNGHGFDLDRWTKLAGIK